ncbi:MAG TPA: fructose-specific PTS transporter subunit EIIC [Nocardioidaceae bacterium]
MSELINSALVALDASYGDTKDDVIHALAGLVAADGRSTDAAGLADDAFAREAKSVTGMPGGLAIPHCRSEYVLEPTLAFARLSPPVDFGAKDGPADLVFMIAAPAKGDQEHMKLLTKLARALVRKEFTDALRSATSAQQVVELVTDVVAPAPVAVTSSAAEPAATTQPAPAPRTEHSAAPGAGTTIVAVTSCPTGIAHTYMAAEALAEAGAKAGVNLVVEPQGSVGAEKVAPSVIRSASAVIFAADVGVRDKGRFAGLPEVKASVKQGIHEADDLVARALAAADDPNAPRVSGDGAVADEGSGEQSVWIKARTALLTGVSYMIPFVAAGGLLIALGFAFGGYQVDPTLATTNSFTHLPDASQAGGALFNSPFFLYLGAVMLFIGKAAFALFIPALGGYIAYAIADRPGIAPGFVVGLISGGGGAVGGLDGVGAGFIGAIVGGFVAGVVALWISRWPVPRFVRGLMPVVIIPLLATIIAAGLMVVFLGRPLSWLTSELTDGLSSMSGTYSVLLGVVLGLMMCFDLGGPVNKAAYVFATTGLGAAASSANLRIMAAVMLAGMVPPLAMALASTVRPQLFTEPELENGRAAWLLGASFISEGAIPFAAADPLRVIPAMMLGGAITGGLSEAFAVELSAPHGGIFVLFAVDGVFWFLVALAAGVIAAAATVIALKTAHRSTKEVRADAEAPVPATV